MMNFRKESIMGLITSFKRFEIHDGDGIRTTVFFSGCPLRCVWCHNPETLEGKPVLSLAKNKCISCGECAAVCKTGALSTDAHSYNREKCIACGDCVPVCLGEALTLYGTEYTVEKIMPKLLEDRAFYGETGGVTLSGGEPMRQLSFLHDLLIALKKEGINTAVDTCGFAPTEAYQKIMPYVDCFLFDIKAIDPEVHKACTGVTNELILKNFRMLYENGARIEVRTPYVMGKNDGEIEKIADFLKDFPGVPVKLLPYHNYAEDKYKGVGLNFDYDCMRPSPEAAEKARDVLRSRGIKVITTD